MGVFRTEDGGVRWIPKNNGVQIIIPDKDHPDIGVCVHALVQDPENPDTIWQQNHRGMYRSMDGGDSWQSIQNGLPSTFGFPLVRDPHSGFLFCFPLHSDEYRLPVDGKCLIYRSRDRGDSWEPMGEGLSSKRFYAGVLRSAMDIDGLDPCGLYFGTTSGTVHTSNDGGESWQTLPYTLPRILTVRVFQENDG